jgi:hypothetical protein
MPRVFCGIGQQAHAVHPRSGMAPPSRELLIPIPMAVSVCPVVASREIVTRLPIPVRVGEAARIEPLSIDRLVFDARLDIDALLAINGRCLVVVVMMFDDLAVDDRRPFVSLSFFWIGTQISSQCRASEPEKRRSHEDEAFHLILRIAVFNEVATTSLNGN